MSYNFKPPPTHQACTKTYLSPTVLKPGGVVTTFPHPNIKEKSGLALKTNKQQSILIYIQKQCFSNFGDLALILHRKNTSTMYQMDCLTTW